MDTLGQHILLDLYHCQNADKPWDDLKEIFYKGLNAGNFTVLNDHHHTFEPHGVSGMFILAESHLSFHIWVEKQFVSLDIYWCGSSCDEQKLVNIITAYFLPEKLDYHFVQRGIFED